MYVIRGSVRSSRRRISSANPAASTASNRTPLAAIDATSSRDSVARCSGGEIEIEAGHRQELVGEDLAGTDRAGERFVGLDHPLQAQGRQALDAFVRVLGAGLDVDCHPSITQELRV